MEYRHVLKVLSANLLLAVEMPSQEAAWYLLKQDTSSKNRDVIYIPTCLPEARIRVRKTREQMVEEGFDKKSTHVWKHDVVQRYKDRPSGLDDVCLTDVVAKYSHSKQYVARQQIVVIRFRHYKLEQTFRYKR